MAAWTQSGALRARAGAAKIYSTSRPLVCRLVRLLGATMPLPRFHRPACPARLGLRFRSGPRPRAVAARKFHRAAPWLGRRALSCPGAPLVYTRRAKKPAPRSLTARRGYNATTSQGRTADAPGRARAVPPVSVLFCGLGCCTGPASWATEKAGFSCDLGQWSGRVSWAGRSYSAIPTSGCLHGWTARIEIDTLRTSDTYAPVVSFYSSCPRVVNPFKASRQGNRVHHLGVSTTPPIIAHFSQLKRKANEDEAEAREATVSSSHISSVTNILSASASRFKLPPPPLYPGGGPKSHAKSTSFAGATATREHCELGRSSRTSSASLTSPIPSLAPPSPLLFPTLPLLFPTAWAIGTGSLR